MRKSIVIREEGDEVLAAQGGLAVVGVMFAELLLGAALNQTCVPDAEHPEISHREGVTSYISLLSQAQSDFDPIETYRQEPFFVFSLARSYGNGWIKPRPREAPTYNGGLSSGSAVCHC